MPIGLFNIYIYIYWCLFDFIFLQVKQIGNINLDSNGPLLDPTTTATDITIGNKLDELIDTVLKPISTPTCE